MDERGKELSATKGRSSRDFVVPAGDMDVWMLDVFAAIRTERRKVLALGSDILLKHEFLDQLGIEQAAMLQARR